MLILLVRELRPTLSEESGDPCALVYPGEAGPIAGLNGLAEPLFNRIREAQRHRN
jgi:hypothetical protein